MDRNVRFKGIKEFLVFSIGFLLFYFLSCWIGIDILHIPLQESFLLLGSKAKTIKILLLISPIISMLIAEGIGGYLLKQKVTQGNIPNFLKFLSYFLVPFVILQSLQFEMGSSIVLGTELFEIWQEALSKVKFRLLFFLIAPAIGLICAIMVTVIFTNIINTSQEEKEKLIEEEIEPELMIIREISIPLCRLLGSLGFILFSLGFMYFQNIALDLNINWNNPFSTPGLGEKGLIVFIISFFMGIIGSLIGWSIGIKIKIKSEKIKQLIMLLWHYGVNGFIIWTFLSLNALFLTVGKAGLKEIYSSMGMQIFIVVLVIGVLGSWLISILLSLIRKNYILSSIFPVIIGLSMGFIQSIILDIPPLFELIAGFLYPFFLIPVSTYTIKRDVKIEYFEENKPKKGEEIIRQGSKILYRDLKYGYFFEVPNNWRKLRLSERFINTGGRIAFGSVDGQASLNVSAGKLDRIEWEDANIRKKAMIEFLRTSPFKVEYFEEIQNIKLGGEENTIGFIYFTKQWIGGIISSYHNGIEYVIQWQDTLDHKYEQIINGIISSFRYDFTSSAQVNVQNNTSLSLSEINKYLILAQQALDRDDFRNVNRYLELARKEILSNSEKAIAFRIESDMLRKKGNLKESITALEFAVKLDPNEPSYWNNLAARRILLINSTNLSFSEKKALLKQAEEESLKAISLSDYVRPHQNLAYIYWELGDIDKAKKEALIARDMAEKQIKFSSSGKIICKGCLLKGKVIEECQKCLNKAKYILRNIELESGNYIID